MTMSGCINAMIWVRSWLRYARSAAATAASAEVGGIRPTSRRARSNALARASGSTGTAGMPTARAPSMQYGVSSRKTTSLGANPKSAAAFRYGPGAGLRSPNSVQSTSTSNLSNTGWESTHSRVAERYRSLLRMPTGMPAARASSTNAKASAAKTPSPSSTLIARHISMRFSYPPDRAHWSQYWSMVMSPEMQRRHAGSPAGSMAPRPVNERPVRRSSSSTTTQFDSIRTSPTSNSSALGMRSTYLAGPR